MTRDQQPRLRAVKANGPTTLSIRFAGSRRHNSVELAGLFARSIHFAPLLADPESFRKAKIVDRGLGVAWPFETRWGRLDLSADTLARIAEEQQPMSGRDFAAWRNALGLSLNETATLLGVSRRTVMGYLKLAVLPTVVAIACRALAHDRNLVAAHFTPSRRQRKGNFKVSSRSRMANPSRLQLAQIS